VTALRFIVALAGSLLAAAPAQPTVYLIGDSTMADRPTPERNPYRGWGQMLQQFFDDSVTVRNFAVNGRSTKSFIDEGRWTAVLRQLQPGDYLVIQFGHNDEKREDPKRYTDPDGSYRTNLQRFVEESRAKGATPILCTSIARRSFTPAGAVHDTHGAYPQAVREVAAEQRVPLVDLQQTTAALLDGAGPERSKALFGWVAPGTNAMCPQGLTDDTHLSVAGATEVARLAARGIVATGLPLGRHVRSLE
jgi:DNA sulfur modification protein DndE